MRSLQQHALETLAIPQYKGEIYKKEKTKQKITHKEPKLMLPSIYSLD